MKKIIAYIDGASKGNPGEASIGFIAYSENGAILQKHGDGIGTATNNVAEYVALITALIKCFQYTPDKLEIRSDSLLLVRQMTGEYKVRDHHLQQFHFIASRLTETYKKVVFVHVPREENRQADSLANFKEPPPFKSELF